MYLPDGRIQTVKYTADHYNGYVAEVSYEGNPIYHKPSSEKNIPYKTPTEPHHHKGMH